jgi:hypothetical protein
MGGGAVLGIELRALSLLGQVFYHLGKAPISYYSLKHLNFQQLKNELSCFYIFGWVVQGSLNERADKHSCQRTGMLV